MKGKCRAGLYEETIPPAPGVLSVGIDGDLSVRIEHGEIGLRPDGERLSIAYEYAPVFGAWGSIGELLAAQWKQIGIELILKEEARQLMYERKAANEHDMGV